MSSQLRASVLQRQRGLLRQIVRRQWILECASLLALAAAGCRRERAQGRSSRLTILYPGDEWILGPAADMQAKLLVFLPLAGRNSKGELERRLAQSWEHSPDYRTWTVHLRPDVRWHDGVPVTAHDIAFTLDLLTRVPESVSPYISPGRALSRCLTITLTGSRCTGGPPALQMMTGPSTTRSICWISSTRTSSRAGSSGHTPWATARTVTCGTCPRR